MDVAKRIARWIEQSPEQRLAAVNRYLPPIVTAALIVAIAYKLADITWTLAPGEPLDAPPPVVASAAAASAAASTPSADWSGLARSHLFGRAAAEAPAPRPRVVDAPETTLSLRLTGLVAAIDSETGQAMAVIASGRNQEKAYRIGQAIDGANGVTLHSVYRDRIILSRGGGLETLRLPELVNGGGQSMQRAAPPMPAAAALEAPVPVQTPSLREAISDNATRLSNIIRIAPHVEGGQMVGFRINPGRDREAFAALGLEPGDVVTDINGTPLDDQARGLQVFETLGEATMANVTIMRGGAPQVIVIDTSQLDSLVEGRQ